MWDLRTFRPLHAYYSPAPAEWCDISQRGMLAVGYGRRVQVRGARRGSGCAQHVQHCRSRGWG